MLSNGRIQGHHILPPRFTVIPSHWPFPPQETQVLDKGQISELRKTGEHLPSLVACLSGIWPSHLM